jgi:hypothetical protein
VLLIPSATSEGSQRVTLALGTLFDDAVETIHEIIGCATITRKPELSYRLSSSTLKSDAVNLGSAADWDGCLDDVAAAEGKKRGLVVTVKIHVSDVVCGFLSFESRNLLIIGLFST